MKEPKNHYCINHSKTFGSFTSDFGKTWICYECFKRTKYYQWLNLREKKEIDLNLSYDGWLSSEISIKNIEKKTENEKNDVKCGKNFTLL